MRNFDDLVKLSKSLPPKKIVVANPVEKTTLEALTKASNLFSLTSILIGSKLKIEQILKENKINLKNYQIIDIEDLEEIAKTAVKIVKNKEADILMKGLIDTKVILKAVVNREEGIRTDKLLSHVTVFSFPSYHKLLFASDCAMIIEPTLEQKIAITNNLLDLFKKLKIKEPKIGIISAVEKVNPKMLSSVHAEQLKDYYQKKNNPFLVDGPFAIDNVVSKDSAKIKNIKSPVAGDADGLIFPDIDAGNVFYKTSVYLAEALAAGLILGAKVPIVLTSRADSLKTKYYSILLAGVYSNEN